MCCPLPLFVKWLHKQNQYILTNLLQSSSHYNVVSLTTLFSILLDLKVVIVKQSYIPYVYFHGVAYIIVAIFHNCCCDCIESHSKRTHSWRSPQFSPLSMKNVSVCLNSISSLKRTVVWIAIKFMKLPQPTYEPLVGIQHHQIYTIFVKNKLLGTFNTT